MDRTPLRVCRVCRGYKVGLFAWLLGKRMCEKCSEKSVRDEMEKYDREVEETLKGLDLESIGIRKV